MEVKFRSRNSIFNDREIVDRIITFPYDDEAAAYLIQVRYAPLLKSIYRKVFDNDLSWYEDCLQDFFIFLKGKDLSWSKFRTFEWKSKLGTWLGRIAYNRFLERKPFLIGNPENTIFIDDDEKDGRVIQLPDRGEQEYEKTEMNILLMEAISLLEDPDQKFVVLKRLQGYNSKEIAQLMQKRWEKHGIVKYNYKNQRVTPDAAYVDVRMQRAKDNLGSILKTLM